MANPRADLEGSGLGALSEQIQAAEQDYLTCVADFGCESAEALSAQWHLREPRRQAHCG